MERLKKILRQDNWSPGRYVHSESYEITNYWYSIHSLISHLVMILKEVMEIPALTGHTSALWKWKPRNGSLSLNRTTSELSDILVYAFCSYNCSLSVKHFASCCSALPQRILDSSAAALHVLLIDDVLATFVLFTGSRGSSVPVTVAAPSVFGRSSTGVVVSNPTRGMDVYLRLFCIYFVLCR
jgi:hypothetical protein